MNSQIIASHLLEDEEFVPKGYALLDRAEVGNYVLQLWQGTAHVDGKPKSFNELSLNAKGRSFDKESQMTKHGGSMQALGLRDAFMRIIDHWLEHYGKLYVGSWIEHKLKIYHRMFKTNLDAKRFNISELFAPFDECKGVPEYFLVTHKSKRAFFDELPYSLRPAMQRAALLFRKRKADVDPDSYGELVDEVVQEVMTSMNLGTDNEKTNTQIFRQLHNSLMLHVYPKQ